ncbi:hypothetical protein A2634_00175 [Candidatus Amesbacteria bacterium RIFCSPHIGHO2_01_FULL_48_32]|uniref:Thioredoxin domain-containing protein n=1 Tax=Candidatus Amesbacteria bacterium RIFCSPLOWO2_01_FULL_48_25 TaxID=1797259 RepID=A0A1F4ZCT1_9BACT|nr:MAG: hypothetical protein A2634_00175 [Candidatus Amesbacteria bacterium RIFCSPHIGHO2_01_FULL_48_32]OGD03224.1 MAG: hypothetical protein A2989_00125 [Candidatus Amesbacteria bacterium RIFCSPLOWO2_01_FULL_48_25]HJZ05168.1 peroxiredoxin family protein [Patescibacteria group bacterium]
MSKSTIIIIEAVLAVVIFGSIFFKSTSTPPSPAPVSDPMADHHKPQPADTGIFSALLNQPAPDFTLTSFDDKKISLSDLLGKNVLLFFNEGLMCYPACWDQIAAFGADREFATANTVVLNITVDPQSQWQQAIAKMPKLATAIVLLDTDKTVSNKYGVTTLESSMHRSQFPGHTYVLIDKRGIVRFQLDDPTMAIRNKQLLDEIAKL